MSPVLIFDVVLTKLTENTSMRTISKSFIEIILYKVYCIYTCRNNCPLLQFHFNLSLVVLIQRIQSDAMLEERDVIGRVIKSIYQVTLGILPWDRVPSELKRGITDIIRLPKRLFCVMKKPSDCLLLC